MGRTRTSLLRAAELRARPRRDLNGSPGDLRALPRRRPRARVASEVDVLKANPGKRRAFHSLDQPGLDDLDAPDVPKRDAPHDGQGVGVEPLVGVVPDVPRDLDPLPSLLDVDVGEREVSDDTAAARVGLDVDPDADVVEAYVLGEDVADPARGLAPDRDPGEGGRPGHAADRDAAARAAVRDPVLVPPALHRHQVVPRRYVRVLYAHVRARVCVFHPDQNGLFLSDARR